MKDPLQNHQCDMVEEVEYIHCPDVWDFCSWWSVYQQNKTSLKTLVMKDHSGQEIFPGVLLIQLWHLEFS